MSRLSQALTPDLVLTWLQEYETPVGAVQIARDHKIRGIRTSYEQRAAVIRDRLRELESQEQVVGTPTERVGSKHWRIIHETLWQARRGQHDTE